MSLRRTPWLAPALLLAFAFSSAPAAEESDPALNPEKGETLLNAAAAEKVLQALAERFKKNPSLRARIVTEVNDELLGKRTEEGELLLDRPGRVLRKFTKPSAKFWLLDGTLLQEYLVKSKKLYVKDFSKAPRALKLLQAAVTVDAPLLGEHFDIHVFEAATEGENKERAQRLVLTQQPGAKVGLPYRRIQARIAAAGLFFQEIEYVPEGGEVTLERYVDIKSVARPADGDFALNVPEDATRKTVELTDPEK